MSVTRDDTGFFRGAPLWQDEFRITGRKGASSPRGPRRASPSNQARRKEGWNSHQDKLL
eukprot:m.1516074 g.1516074  ORF g.1516074 m.1516074 type:complete len:59 (-) comp25217_c0_seq48:2175-2351(-)